MMKVGLCRCLEEMRGKVAIRQLTDDEACTKLATKTTRNEQHRTPNFETMRSKGCPFVNARGRVRDFINGIQTDSLSAMYLPQSPRKVPKRNARPQRRHPPPSRSQNDARS